MTAVTTSQAVSAGNFGKEEQVSLSRPEIRRVAIVFVVKEDLESPPKPRAIRLAPTPSVGG